MARERLENPEISSSDNTDAWRGREFNDTDKTFKVFGHWRVEQKDHCCCCCTPQRDVQTSESVRKRALFVLKPIFPSIRFALSTTSSCCSTITRPFTFSACPPLAFTWCLVSVACCCLCVVCVTDNTHSVYAAIYGIIMAEQGTTTLLVVVVVPVTGCCWLFRVCASCAAK